MALVHETNQGVGGATITGYRKALEFGCDVVVKIDGDGQMPLEQLPELLDAIVMEGYGYAKGNRFLDSGLINQMPRGRILGNILLTFLTKLASGYWHVFDPQNGLTAIKASCLKNVPLERVHKRYFFENDMRVQLNIQKRRVKDVPMPAVYGLETSGISIVFVLAAFPSLLLRRFVHRVYQKYVLRDFSSIAVFLGIGSVLLGWGGDSASIYGSRAY